MKSISVLIQGGLGNQLFCYAAGYSLAKKNNCKLNLDLYDFKHGYFRPYKLDSLNIEYDRECNLPSKNNRFFYYFKRFFLRNRWLLEKKYYVFQDIFSNKINNGYLEGYWQSEKYFLYTDDIRKLITLKKSNDNAMLEHFRNKISNYNNTVAVQIRRGDFASGGNSVDLAYYKAAFNEIEKRIDSPTYIFFSDDVEFVKTHFDFESNKNYFVAKELFDVKDDVIELFCLAACSHQIICNSSFAWWGAWLNPNPNKIVVASLLPDLKNTDYYPNNWITIDANFDR